MASKKAYVNLSTKYDRVIVLVDMDCFYCQVEEKLNPSLAGKPLAVVQYNTWQGGGIIAVNYAARAAGVTRHMRGDEAKEQCPEIELVSVPSVRDKADLTKYREAGKEVALVLHTFTQIMERASVDEAYLDITEIVLKRLDELNEGKFELRPSELKNTYIVGHNSIGDYIQEISSKVDINSEEMNFEYDESDMPAIQKSDIKLLIGATIAGEIRDKVKEKTGYECSAGIAHNKILAKLACGINKPNKQTVLPLSQIGQLFNTLPIGKIKGLGGKFGEEVCEKLKVKFIGDLQQFTETELQQKFDEKSGSWLYLIARGIDLEAVTPRFFTKSIGCCKKFPGKNCITGFNTLKHWLLELSKEICERMEKDTIENNRKAKQMILSYIQEINGEDVSSSRSTNMIAYEAELLSKYALDLLRKNTDQFFKTNQNENNLNNPIKFLGISVGKFETIETKQNTLEKLFANHSKKKSIIEEKPDDNQGKSETNQNENNLNNSIKFLGTNVGKLETIETKQNTLEKLFANHSKKTTLIEEKSDDNQEKSDESKSYFAPYLKSFSKLNENNKSTSSSDCDASHEEKQKSYFYKALKAAEKSKEPFSRNIEQNTENILKNTKLINENIPQSNENIIEKSNIKNSEDIPNEKVTTVENIEMNEESYEVNVEQHELENQNNFEPVASTSSYCPKKNESDNQNRNDYDYTKEYVEFAVPETHENDYVTCEKCNKKILSYTIQTHMDYHYAFEISREQREKYREEIKLKIKSPPAKKPKINTTINKKTNKNLTNNENTTLRESKILEKFLIKNTDKNPSNSSINNSNEPKELCSECGNHIPITQIVEHHDYHLAKKIQMEFNHTNELQEQAAANN